MKRLIGSTLLAILLSSGAVAAPLYTTPTLLPTSSYLLGDPTTDQPTFLADTEHWPFFIFLGNYGLTPGQQITISGSGGLCYGPGCVAELPAEFGLVFTTTTDVDRFFFVDRLDVADGGNVPLGATGVVSPVTYYNGYSTDIAGDFALIVGNTLTVTIPTGASYLAIGILDSYFRDNYELGAGDITLTIGTPDSMVPEPSTYLMAFAGLAGLWTLRRKRA